MTTKKDTSFKFPVNPDFFKFLLKNNTKYLNDNQINLLKYWIKNPKEHPTANQMKKLAKLTDTPYGYFFGSKVPKWFYENTHFFNQSKDYHAPYLFRNFLSTMHFCQGQLIRSRLTWHNITQPSISPTDTPEDMANMLVKYLGIKQGQKFTFASLRQKLMFTLFTISFHDCDPSDMEYSYLGKDVFKGFNFYNYRSFFIVINSNCSPKEQLRLMIGLAILNGTHKNYLITNHMSEKLNKAVDLFLSKITYVQGHVNNYTHDARFISEMIRRIHRNVLEYTTFHYYMTGAPAFYLKKKMHLDDI